MEKDFDKWNVSKKSLDKSAPFADCHEREIWWCAIGVNVGSEQQSQTNDFSRPIVIVKKFTRDIFLAIPLTTKIKDNLNFRMRFILGETTNDLLILQMRAYDRKRLLRKIGIMPIEDFEKLKKEIKNLI